ncbi:hypothetical protein BASA81_000062 [Batrachochytrium salamandrivorans]|nr:hypothetical protein BASA81_000062 [Batrachochytrium salamandrivorans]
MPIISAAITTRSGKVVLSRQFVEISRMRVEALLSGFPKLLSPSKLQQQYIDADTVRYLFQPMESLFILLITTKNSNIVEDLDTLRLLAKVVVDACAQQQQQNYGQDGSASLGEDVVLDCAFEIVAALDEVISCGYREPNLTLALIRANLEMNSHEEKLSQMIRQTKETDAKQEMKRKAAAIHATKEGGGKPMDGFGSNPYSGPSSSMGGGSMGMGGGSMGSRSDLTEPLSSPTAAAPTAKPTIGKQGMKLVKKQRDVSEALFQEDGMEEEPQPITLGTSQQVAQPISNKDPVFCLVSEQVSCTIQQDGRVSSFQVQGQVSLISRVAEQPFAVQLAPRALAEKLYSFKPHPQVDKQKLEKQNVLCLKQQDRSLPVNTPFGALKYYFNAPSSGKLDVEHIPLSLTVWPESGGGNGLMNVNLEYELHCEVDLVNVTICIPLGGSQEQPEVRNCSIGTHRHNSKRHQLEWTIDLISPSDEDSRTGSFEFNLGRSEPSAFFPTVISFTSAQSLASVGVEQVVDLRNNQPIRFGSEVQVTTDAYEVVSEE